MARRAARLRRAQWSPAEWATIGRQIAARCQALAPFAAARVVASYLALPDEVPTAPLIAACRQAGKRVCVPAYDARAGRYRFAWLTENDTLIQGRWGIPEPAAPEWVETPEETVHLVLVPGLQFDRARRRLGYGGGFFDRLLEGLAACKIGLAAEAQLARRVPVAEHDVAMDLVVTEKGLYPAPARRPRKSVPPSGRRRSLGRNDARDSDRDE
ncbi:MAG: 5-formyltetrahydrofolate cyclo-ligase [Kiritimatiellaeota bacterium]|nr:5-formyltetrahydrofolate cyclo-ligase [Kiritimatiellota bacterium]